MSTKNKLYRQVFGYTLAFVAVLIAGSVLTRALYYNPDSTDSTLASVTEAATSDALSTGSKPKTKPAPPTYPSRLLIPSLGIDAHVQYVGLSIHGTIAVPSNYTDVAWYDKGTVPGKIGNAVMDGHVDNGLALPGVFKHLDNIQTGDDVYVTRNDGTKLHFVVTGTQLYPFDSAPDESVLGPSDGAHLNLVTCTGDWVSADKTYSNRLVVFTKLAS